MCQPTRHLQTHSFSKGDIFCLLTNKEQITLFVFSYLSSFILVVYNFLIIFLLLSKLISLSSLLLFYFEYTQSCEVKVILNYVFTEKIIIKLIYRLERERERVYTLPSRATGKMQHKVYLQLV